MPTYGDLFDSLIMQESGGRAGIPGQRTKWGRPMGLTQMLPATAREMAGKAGLPWDERLLSDKTDRGYAYQKRLGQEYFKEGLDKTGNVRDALHYYHGGPNRKMWGPKTRSYADQILARASQGQEMLPTNRRLPGQVDPITAALGRMTPVANGFDPLAPVNAPQPPQMAQQMGMPQGMPQSNLASAQFMPPQQSQQPEGKPKAFGKGGAGWAILGAIGDALSAYGGQQGVFAPMMADQMARDQQEKLMRDRMTAEAEQRMAEIQAKANEPRYITNSAGDNVAIYPNGQQEVVYMDPYGKPRSESRVNPATGALEIFNTGSTPRPQADDVEDLRRNPSLAADFDAEFGPGAAAYILRQGGR